jgi:archaellum component FlaF (FlaF/FlaG flagellin family)
MNASKIESCIKSLGQTHENLLSELLVSDGELVELFPGDDQVYLQPEKGISMTFRDDDAKFESFCITLVKVVPEEQEYSRDLPDPYTS